MEAEPHKEPDGADETEEIRQARIFKHAYPIPKASGISGGKEDLPVNEMKYDEDACPVHLLPVTPMWQIAEVFGYGAKKYAVNSYRRGDRKSVPYMRTMGSVLRHCFKWIAGEEKDPDTGLSHLAHAATQLMILMEHSANGTSEDDRFITEEEKRPWN